MRIVIDLQCCQAGSNPAALALAQDMVRSAGARDVWIALSDRHCGAIEALRQAFAPLLPADRVRVLDLPAAGGAWLKRAAALVRENALAALDTRAVFLPHATGASVVGAVSAAAPFASVQGSAGLSAAEAWQLVDAALETPPAPAAAKRPRLALISPLPPEKSGIADYSAELAPQLARFYDVELIVDQPGVDQARIGGALPLRQLDWFEQHAHEFDHLLYHFGNSMVHKHMFALIRRHPGVVVLHDFFFSGVLDNAEREGVLPLGYLAGLYESHGYSGLLAHRLQGRNPSIWAYPLNKGVLDNATGVIVHSDFSKQLATQWYGPGAADGWRTIPLLRGAPAGSERAAARARLGLEDGDFMVCSFGMLGRTKLNEELLDAYLGSTLAADPRCRLVFVGENEAGLYGATLQKRIGAARRIAITGFASAETYADYLAACDTAVQLRSATRGETSAAVLDCLLHGAPTIANAHGATAAIGDDLLVKLPDQFSAGELAAALERLHGDGALRAALSQRARAFMQAEHAPQRVGVQYAEAIDQFGARGRHAHYARLIDALGRLPAAPEPSHAELAGLARAIAWNQPTGAPRQLLVDVSAVVQADLKTGIQRVVRSVLLALIADPPPGYRIEPVFSTGANRPYQYARQFGLGLVGETGLPLEDAPVDLRPGDVFLGLDLFTNGTSQNQQLLQSMRDHGVQIYFVVYDLLPVLRPDVFPFGTEQYFSDFLRTVSTVSHGVLCISRAVADELVAWLGQQSHPRPAPLQVGYFHLGADIHASAPSFGLPPNAAQVLDAVRARPSFLMVGTVEPRKGHTQALAAFDQLWQQGEDINLIIVGKQGWLMEPLCERMASHPESQVRLFWLPGVSDEMLLALYTSCAALLSPSEGEGFGLPLIEAAQHNVPIIARSLPVFREVAGEHAHYFDGLAPSDLAAAVHSWLVLHRDGQAPSSSQMPWLTWSDSARQVRDAIVDQHWYRSVAPNAAPGLAPADDSTLPSPLSLSQ